MRARSGAADWPPIAACAAWEARLGAAVRQRGPLARAVYEFLRFGAKQAWACLFGGALLALILGSRLWYPRDAPLARYDALVLACLALQALLLLLRLETLAEAEVILVFHVVGTLMELFKTAVGSWTYPEASLLRLGAVPLFTGFMYAAVGSYLARVWRLFDFRFTHHPGLPALAALSVAIYANFFTDHWGLDLRWALIAVAERSAVVARSEATRQSRRRVQAKLDPSRHRRAGWLRSARHDGLPARDSGRLLRDRPSNLRAEPSTTPLSSRCRCAGRAPVCAARRVPPRSVSARPT